MNPILKQLVSVGILSERVYSMPEDSDGDHTSVDQAKIDPELPQQVDADPNPQEEDGDEGDSADGEPKPEVDEDEQKPAETTNLIQVDGPRALAALHSQLHAAQVTAELVDAVKPSLSSHIGAEWEPALHEILFKVKSAHELIAKLMDHVGAKPAETDEPGMGDAESDDADSDAAGDDDQTSDESTEEPKDDETAA